MVDQLPLVLAEVTRVAKEVGTEGKLGGQAQVEGVSGVWKDLTENVNTLADNLTDQVEHRRRDDRRRERRPLEEDHRRRPRRGARGEGDRQHDGRPAALLRRRVTRLARGIGTEGRLGGQAQVEGVSGVWKDLTDNVNSSPGTDRPGAEHRHRHHRRRERRPLQEDHRRRQGRDPRAQGHDQHDGRPALRSPPRSHASPARSAPRASSAARLRSRASRARGAG